ncbi:hypothetical protein V6Z12_A06G204200 [Gossypium hirsutum]
MHNNQLKLGPIIDAAGASGVNILCCSSGSIDDAICLLYMRKEVV